MNVSSLDKRLLISEASRIGKKGSLGGFHAKLRAASNPVNRWLITQYVDRPSGHPIHLRGKGNPLAMITMFPFMYNGVSLRSILRI